MWAAVSTFLRTWGLVVALVAGGLAVAWRFVDPAPPDVIRVATGPGPDSAYTHAAQAYARGLRAEGFRVELRETNGSVDNVALLRDRAVDLALVQGGVARADTTGELRSLGAVFQEPAWVFMRRGEAPSRVQGLRGRRVALGPPGSGTRALALAMLGANGLDETAMELVPLTGLPAAEALLAGEVDAAFLVSAVPGEGIGRLMRAEGAELVDFATRAAAYATLLPYLTPVTLPRSGFSLPEDLPDRDVTLLAPAAALLTHDALHPQIASLMVRIMQETHRHRQTFAPEGRFPNGLNQDVPLQRDARRIYERGQGFLQAWLPFRAAVTVERLWVLLIPLITLALPLIRFAPPLYTWQMESRIWRHYDALRRIEAELPKARDKQARATLRTRLEGLEQEVAAISVPASYARQVFALRRDIAYLRTRVPDR